MKAKLLLGSGILGMAIVGLISISSKGSSSISKQNPTTISTDIPSSVLQVSDKNVDVENNVNSSSSTNSLAPAVGSQLNEKKGIGNISYEEQEKVMRDRVSRKQLEEQKDASNKN